jgi:hypothetical protein
MQTRAFRPPSAPVQEGSCRTLFLAIARKATGVPDDVSQASAALGDYMQKKLHVNPPDNVRLHRHKETGAWIGTAHVIWKAAADAECALVALQSGNAPTLWGVQPRVERAQDDTQVREGKRAGDSESRLAVCKLALERFTERAVAFDLAHACGLLLVGSRVSMHCRLTAALRLFADRAASAMTDDEQFERKGGCTRLHTAYAGTADSNPLLCGCATAPPVS